MSRKMSRRDFMRLLTAGTGGIVLASCTPSTPETITVVETKEVIKEVTATPPSVVQEELADVLGTFPRRETLIADILTGRCGSPDNFNEWVGWKNRDRGMQTLANEPLWSVDFASGEIVNGLADGDAKYNADFTTCEIPLRKGVTWDDGEPFTAADVVFTIETLMSDDQWSAGSFFKENVKSVTAKDDNTVVFELAQSNSRFHTRFLDRWGCTWIMPKHIFEKETDKINFKFNPFVGCGPYKLHSFDPQGFWTAWVKRDDWDKSPTGIMYGEPKPKYIVYQNFANEGAKILAQLTHQADYLNLSSDGLKAILAQSKSSRAYQPTFPWVVNNDPCITGITINTARPPFDNVEVRWALLLAIDIVAYCATAVDGTGTLSPVHVPHLGAYPKDYIKPMQDWLKKFTIDVDGEAFAPYDPEAPKRIAEYAKGRGYVFPDTPEFTEQAFGLGWYKYAPEVAEKLLLKNGFKRDKDNKWLLPNGKPWKITYLCATDTTTHATRNAMGAVQEWKKFGIDSELFPSDAGANLNGVGDFDVSGNWPAQEPWGAGADLYRTLDWYNKTYIKPVGELTSGHPSRWCSDTLMDIIKELRETDPADTAAVIEVGTKGLQELVKQMPGIPTYGYTGFLAWDETYWTNWPGSENAYSQPYPHWGPFKYQTPKLKATGA
ncbi:MAG TPA: ABC transporter substrate-binding protein [Anaerolineaceae bacterium]|nr:ABC transporter substrate-binding protein [Anaerolineaceae bacterium]